MIMKCPVCNGRGRMQPSPIGFGWWVPTVSFWFAGNTGASSQHPIGSIICWECGGRGVFDTAGGRVDA